MTGTDIIIWRKELVYIAMVLFILAACLHLCIRIFLVCKLGKKEFLTKSSVLALTLVGAFSSVIMLYTKMVSHIKDQFHPSIALLFNVLGTSLLGYLFISNEEALKMVRLKFRKYKVILAEKREIICVASH